MARTGVGCRLDTKNCRGSKHSRVGRVGCVPRTGIRGVAILGAHEAEGFPSEEVITPTAPACGSGALLLLGGGLPASSGTITLASLGFRAKVVPFSLRSGEERVIPDASLEPGPSFGLRIQDDRGRPVVQARVSLVWTVGAHAEKVELQVGADGVLTVPHFDLGTIDLEFTAPCCAPSVALDVAPDRLRALDPVRLPRLGEIAGECRPAEHPEFVLVGCGCLRDPRRAARGRNLHRDR